MDPQDWRRVEEIFAGTLEMPPEKRAAFLDRACRGDARLRSQVEELLEQDRRAGSEDFLAPGAANVKAQFGLEEDPLIGARLGPFEIVRRIGRGGMGNVYLASRTEGYRQNVAVKVLKRGMDSEEILRRFRREIRVLAALSKHAHIAGLLDAGATDEGLPYLVMEYVEGPRIDEYCNRQRLGVRRRLELFCDAASAVHAAHRHGVIHRDLKPSNILIAAGGDVKLIDFGIAKLLAPELSDQTAVPTRTEQRLLTPDYASPEQVRGETITTATDIYSLGVLLYELLTGERPFPGPFRSVSELGRILDEREPAKPSVAVTVAKPDEPSADPASADRATLPPGLSATTLKRQLRGDLDNLVLKALRREPDRRYTSAEEMAEDVRRHLAGHPVAARPIGQAERFWRACRRNPWAASLLLAVAVGMTFGLSYLSWLSRQLVNATAIEGARQQAEMLGAVQDFYSHAVADRAEASIPVTHRYASEENAIPAPATFTIELGEYLRDRGETGMRARLYSDAPFTTRRGGPEDDFQRAAIDALRADPEQPYYQFIDDPRPSLRYATARVMQESCVECHNSHPDSPRTDWRVGDFRGVLEVVRPLDRDIAHTTAALRGAFLSVIGVTAALAAICLAVLFGVPGRRG